MKVTCIPFPAAYAQVTIFLLGLHWLLTPMTIITWASHPSLVFIYTFATIFIFWALIAIAEELQNPFGDDASDLDMVTFQDHLNERLLMLLGPAALHTPRPVHVALGEPLSLGALIGEVS